MSPIPCEHCGTQIPLQGITFADSNRRPIVCNAPLCGNAQSSYAATAILDSPLFAEGAQYDTVANLVGSDGTIELICTRYSIRDMLYTMDSCWTDINDDWLTSAVVHAMPLGGGASEMSENRTMTEEFRNMLLMYRDATLYFDRTETRGLTWMLREELQIPSDRLFPVKNLWPSLRKKCGITFRRVRFIAYGEDYPLPRSDPDMGPPCARKKIAMALENLQGIADIQQYANTWARALPTSEFIALLLEEIAPST